MLNMENAEEVMQILERFTRLKQKEIPKELDDYMHYVAKTGDTVFKWPSLKYLFREKLLNVIKNFHDTSPRVDDLPQYPNVDPFNYESMKSSLLERLELFNAAPFTVQRLCELLTEPRKQYSRIDKFMRALEKNILVSTIEPGRKRTESENGDSLDSVVNGDVSLDVNVDIEMENETVFNAEAQQVNAASSTSPPSQPSSNLTHKADDDILPNPKKPKLDLDETNDAETEAATKSITTIKTDALEVIVEKVAVEEMTDITDNKKNEERIAEAAATAEKAVVEPETKKDNKETEKMDEDSPAVATASEETSSVDTAKEVEPEKKPEEKEATISPENVEAEVAKDTPPAAAPEVVVAVEPVESSEKPEKVDDEPEKKKKDCAEEVLVKKDETKDIDVEKPIKDDVEPQNGENKENEEKTETTTTPEQTNDKQSVATDDAIAPSNENKPDEVVKDKAEETVAAEEPAVEVSAAKADIAASAEEPSKSGDVKPADDTANKAEALPVASEEVKEASTETTTKPPEQVDAAAQPPPPTESPIKEPPVAPAETQPAESKETETEKPVEVVPAAVESTPVVIPVVPIVEPVVPADQPMEENLESIAEAEPVVPAIIVEAAANVEEVVMKDSGVEMATDAIEPSKDEPAGMEVDDTSQEAMDQ